MPALRFIAVPLAITALLSMFTVSAPAAERRVALVIGNSEYQFTNPLRNPRNDAEDIALALGPLGFDVVIKGIDLTEREFADKLREFARAAHGADVTLLFYAGHGVQVDGVNYLIPVDAEIRDELDLRRRTYKLTTFLNEMRGRTNLVFLDACRDNPQVRSLARSLGAARSSAVERGLSPVEIPSGTGSLIAFATQPGNVADDGTGRNSPFTEALLAHIATPGQSVTDMLINVRQAVMNTTRQQQVPWTSESLLTQFYFKPEAPPDPPSPATHVASAPVEPPPGGSDSEQQYEKERMAAMAYQTALSLQSVDLFEEVRTRYPGTIYAKAAEEQIRRFEEARSLPPAAGSAPAATVSAHAQDESSAPPAPPAPATSPRQAETSLGLTPAERRRIQQALASLGYEPGMVDGMFGERTRRAIRKYQAEHGRPATGFLMADEAGELEASRKEAEERRREAELEASRKEAEERRREAELEASRKEAEERRREAELEASRKEAEERRREAELEASRKEAEERRREAELEASRKEAEERRREAELEASRKEAEERRKEAEKRQELVLRADDEAFTRATASGTSRAFREYLTAHSSGRHVAEAKGLLLQAERQERERWAKQSGAEIRDCPDCPQMVVMPLGAYSMGSPSKESGRKDTEGPVHRVTIERPFAAGRHEVTRGQFRRFVDETGHSAQDGCQTFRRGAWKWRDEDNWLEPGFAQTDDHPVVCVGWEDARAYVEWLSMKTDKSYRLLSESEWEYAARGGAQTARYWGDRSSQACKYANVLDRSYRKKYRGNSAIHQCDDGFAATSPVGSRAKNGFGLYDMLGNVWEWVEDCWHAGHSESSADASARNGSGDCSRRVVRGGAWGSTRDYARSAVRVGVGSGSRFSGGGFRVARTLE